MTSSLRSLLLVCLLGLQIVTIIGVLYSNSVRTEALLQNQAQTGMLYWANVVADKTRAYLAPAERVGRLTQELLESGGLNPTDKAQLEDFFIQELKSNPEIGGLSLGLADGGIFSVRWEGQGFFTKSIEVNPEGRSVEEITRDETLAVVKLTLPSEDTLDPRERPWYFLAETAAQQRWTEPYLFFTSRTPGISSGTPVYTQNGDLLGVMGVNMGLAQLTHFLESVPISQNGAAFIVTQDGTVIASPGLEASLETEQPSETLPNLLTTDKAIAEALFVPRMAISENSFNEFQFQGQSYYGSLTPFSIGDGTTWLIGAYAPSEDFIGEFRSQDQRFLFAVLGVGVISCLLAIPIAFRVAMPLESLHRQATRDTLTGLLNRPEFLKRAEQLLNDARKNRTTAAVVMIDLDGFKAVNDGFGHPIGDEVLTIVAQRISYVLRQQDIVGRMGGDEFALVLSDVSFDAAWHLVERVRENITKEPIRSSRGLHPIGASLGVTLTEATGAISDYLEQADQALLKVKATGKNRILFASLKFTEVSEMSKLS
jgi:diguanylate cyclase (GGDEF)-like protein